MSTQWLRQDERGSPRALRLILWIALHLGRRAARLLLPAITLYFFLSSASARRASRRFLSRVRGRPARGRDVYRHMLTFAATILDRVYLLGGQQHRFDVRVHGLEPLLEHLRAGEGCLLLGAHLGSFEVLRAVGIESYDAPLRVLMYKSHNRTVTQLLDQLNPQIADSVIDLGRPDCLLQVKEWTEKGGLVGLLGDRIAGHARARPCQFLGRAAQFPEGPMLVAATLNIPILLIFGLYRGGNRYDVHIEPFSGPLALNRRERGKALDALLQRYADRVAHYAALAPDNWFNFYDFWNEDD